MSEPRQGIRFAAVLNSTRREAGLSYRQLAQASGISHSFLSHVEKGERRAPPARAILALADALKADRVTFALAAIADRAGSDVATTMVTALRRGPVSRDIDPTAGVLIESGPAGAESELADLADHDDAVDELASRLAFVDLQLDVGYMRLGISAVGGSEPIVLFVSARADADSLSD